MLNTFWHISLFPVAADVDEPRLNTPILFFKRGGDNKPIKITE